MLQFLNLNPEIFGIDINDLAIRVVKLRKKATGFVLVAFNEVSIKPGVVKGGTIQDQEELAKTIKLACSTVKGKKLDTKYAVVSLPEEKSFSQLIKMPKMEYKDLKSSVPHEIENYIPLAISNVYLDFKIISEHLTNSDHLDLLVDVMPKPVVDSYVSCLKKAGLIPCVLEVESQAIVRSLIKDGEDSISTIFIDFGQTKSSFIIFSEKSIRFTSSMPISSNQLTDAIAENLGISFEKAEALKIKHGLNKTEEGEYNIKEIVDPILNNLVTQIKKYISFYQGHSSHEHSSLDGRVERIILCGGGAYLKGLTEFMYEELKIPVEIGNPLINISLQKGKKDCLIPSNKILSFTTALGLALRGAGSDDLNNENIIK